MKYKISLVYLKMMTSPVQPDDYIALSLMSMLNKTNQVVNAFRYA
jgi:hypothetical protein